MFPAPPAKTEAEAKSPGFPASAVPACLGGDCLLVLTPLPPAPCHFEAVPEKPLPGCPGLAPRHLSFGPQNSDSHPFQPEARTRISKK